MTPGLLEIVGTIDVAQFWPSGKSDADTSKIHLTGSPTRSGSDRILAQHFKRLMLLRAQKSKCQARVRKK
jgi:hypothetical protein